MKEKNSEIKLYKTLDGKLFDYPWYLDDFIPYEIFYSDNSSKIECTPYIGKKPIPFYTSHAAEVRRIWQEKKDKKYYFLKDFQNEYKNRYPRKYWERKFALFLKKCDLEGEKFYITNKGLNINSPSINVSFPDMNSKNNYYSKKNILNHSWWCDRVIINVLNKKNN